MTPEDVANVLKISVKTVYAQSKKLGGFFPAGIKVLRFFGSREPEVQILSPRPYSRILIFSNVWVQCVVFKNIIVFKAKINENRSRNL
jgi:hypothetical protein